MIETHQKRTITDLNKLVFFLEALYSDFHSSLTSILRVLKETSKELKLTCQKEDINMNIMTFGIFIYQKIWNSSSNKILKLEQSHFFFETLKDRIKQFQSQYKQSRINIIETQKDINVIRNMHSQLQKVYHQYQKPIKYYNNEQRLQLKKLLKEKLQEYLVKKTNFMIDYPSKKKVISYIDHMTDWFTREVDEGLLKGIQMIFKVQDGFLAGIRQFIYYIVDSSTKQVLKLESFGIQSHWTIELQELKRQNLAILGNLQQKNFSQSVETCFQRYFRFCKGASKMLEDEIKQSEILFSQLRMMMQVLNSTKRQIEKELKQTETIKDKLLQICDNHNFCQSYKLTLMELVHIVNITISNISQYTQLSYPMQKLNSIKKDMILKTRTVMNKEMVKNSQNILSLYTHKLRDIENLSKSQKEFNIRVKQALIQGFKKYSQDIKQTQVSLIQGYKNNKKYKSNNRITKTDLIRQTLTIDLLNDDSLEKQISKSLQQFPIFTKSDQENPDKVYSCALSGKIILLGKLKLYPQLILFQSKFNRKNIFFGKTSLVIPMNDIVDITKQSVLLVDNAININTKKGVLTFLSFSNRDKVFQQINEHLQQQEQQVKSVANNSVLSEVSRVEPISAEQLTIIQNKRLNYPKTIFDNYNVFVGTTTFEGISIRKLFRQIYASDLPVIKKKKKYTCFKDFALQSTKNVEVVIGPFKPAPPSYFDPNSTSKLSELQSSERVITYKHELDSLPIPFMPKFGNVTEKQTFNWISDKMIVIEGQNITSGPPYSDTFILRLRTIIEQVQNNVTIISSGTIQFVKSTAFQGVIKSTGQKQINKNCNEVMKLTQQHIKQIKKKGNRSSQAKALNVAQQQIEEDKQKPSSSVHLDDRIKQLNSENKRNIVIASGVFILVLIVTHVIF